MAYKASLWRKILKKIRVWMGEVFMAAKEEKSLFSQQIGRVMAANGRNIITMTTL